MVDEEVFCTLKPIVWSATTILYMASGGEEGEERSSGTSDYLTPLKQSDSSVQNLHTSIHSQLNDIHRPQGTRREERLRQQVSCHYIYPVSRVTTVSYIP